MAENNDQTLNQEQESVEPKKSEAKAIEFDESEIRRLLDRGLINDRTFGKMMKQGVVKTNQMGSALLERAGIEVPEKAEKESLKSNAEKLRQVSEVIAADNELAELVTEKEVSDLRKEEAERGAGAARRIDETIGAIRESAEAGYREGAREAAFREKQAEQIRANEEKRSAIRSAQMKFLDEQNAKLSKQFDELESQKIDSSRFIKNMSTGNKILAGLSIILGSASGAQNNQALKIINNAIDRDIELQKGEIAKKFGVLKGKRSLLDQMRQNFADDRAADAASKAYMLKAAQLELGKFAAKTKSAQARANAEQVINQLEAAAEEQRQKVSVDMLNIFNSGGVVQDVEQQRAILNDPKKAERAIINPKDNSLHVPSAGSKESITKFRNNISTTSAVSQTLGQVLDLAKTSSRFNPVTREAIYKRIRESVGKLRIEMTGGGPLTESEVEVIESALGNPNKIFSLRSVEIQKIKDTIDNMNSNLETEAAGLGLRNFSLRKGKNLKSLRPR